ncbi:MAG: Zn-ribbon domain-containing OB-fold protein [Spongiibacteraceae bacterium]
MNGKKANLEWNLHCDFSQAQGELYSKFMAGLAEKRFLGTRIGDQSFYPVKQFCSATYQEPDEVIECDGKGRVESFTICHKKPKRVSFPDADITLEPPYIVAAIKVADSDQCFLHFLSGVDVSKPLDLLKKVEGGLDVKPVWAEQRHGNVLDILYYEPVA